MVNPSNILHLCSQILLMRFEVNQYNGFLVSYLAPCHKPLEETVQGRKSPGRGIAVDPLLLKRAYLLCFCLQKCRDPLDSSETSGDPFGDREDGFEGFVIPCR